MGQIYSRIFGSEESTIILTGLYGSGKTTLLYHLKLGQITTTEPTTGFYIENLETKKFSVSSWDTGGRNPIRPLVRHYLSGVAVLVFVVDSSNEDLLKWAGMELDWYLQHEEASHFVIMVLVNKQDDSDALPLQEVEKRMDLHNKLKNREAAWFPVSGLKGDGVFEAFSWLSEKLSSNKAREYLNKTSQQANTLKAAAKHVWSVNSLVKSTSGWFKEFLSGLKQCSYGTAQ